MKLLVTGSSGFVGSLLLKQIENCVGVDLIKSDDSRTKVLDVTETQLLRSLIIENEIDCIVHLAGIQYSNQTPKRKRFIYFSKNELMARSISEAVQGTTVRNIVFLSTDMVYGKKIISPVTEQQECKPIGPYGLSKLRSENILATIEGVQLIVFRPRLIIGKGRSGTIQQLASWIKKGFPIPILGNGKSRYQFISVNDCVSAILRAIKSPTAGVYNLGSDNPPQLNQLFAVTLRSIGRKNGLIHLPAVISNFGLKILDLMGLSPLAEEQFGIAALDYVLDTSKIKQTFSWVPHDSDESMLIAALNNLEKF